MHHLTLQYFGAVVCAMDFSGIRLWKLLPKQFQNVYFQGLARAIEYSTMVSGVIWKKLSSWQNNAPLQMQTVLIGVTGWPKSGAFYFHLTARFCAGNPVWLRSVWYHSTKNASCVWKISGWFASAPLMLLSADHFANVLDHSLAYSVFHFLFYIVLNDFVLGLLPGICWFRLYYSLFA